MQEEELYQYWHYYALSGEEVVFGGNHRLRIMTKGENNRQRGPDIQFAKFDLDGIVYQGDVEFHISVGDWYRHGHHLDRGYTNVLLHLVAGGNEGFVLHELNGCRIPTFILPKPTDTFFSRHPAQSCHTPSLNSIDEKDVLIHLALERLEFKVSSCRSSLEYQQPEAVFYQLFFSAMGFPNNKFPFQMLSEKIKISFIQQLYSYNGYEPAILLALYFGLSGFLPVKNPDVASTQFEKAFKKYHFLINGAPLASTNWNLHLVRAHNHPHFRLAAWVYTLSHYYPKSLFLIIKEIFNKRSSFSVLKFELFELFHIEVSGYWKDHFALCKPLNHSQNRYYWGDLRITEIILNVIIPLIITEAELHGSFGFSEYIKGFFLWLSGDINYGKIRRNMPWYSEYKNLLSGPALFQAFLNLEENYCLKYRCAVCPLNRFQNNNTHF